MLVCVRGRPVSPLSFRVVPVPQGRSSFVVASLRDGLRPPLTDRPAPECHKTAGKPPKEWPGGSCSDEGPSEMPSGSPCPSAPHSPGPPSKSRMGPGGGHSPPKGPKEAFPDPGRVNLHQTAVRCSRR
ncbi:hypothetical protein E6W17_11795 [Streptomyces sp. A1547]|nr:hypothetical protein E6W17_11795 [Streptomyces sp. A1547]